MHGQTDEQRFYDLVWPHMAMVLRTAQCMTHSLADAEDLTQDTMLKAFRAIRRVRDGSNIKAWLMTILRNTHIDRVRVARNEMSMDEMELVPAQRASSGEDNNAGFWQNPERVLDSFGDEEIIRALRALPTEIRWTLLLTDVQGMEHREAAQVLAIPVGTVKSRLHRGREMLRGRLEKSRRSVRAIRAEPAMAAV